MSIALVGCGSSGAAIGFQLSKQKLIDELKLIDNSELISRKLSNELEQINPKINYESFKIDVNSDDLTQLFADVDIVINAASPICNIPLMKACLKSKCHYIDLASDPFDYEDIPGETSIDDQLKLNRNFQRNNLIAITNAGASPGFSDILSKHAANVFSYDRINAIHIYFTEMIESKKLVSSWSPYILLLETLLPATVYKNSVIRELESHQRYKNVDFPKPFGKNMITIFNGHPELRTIPDFIDLPVDYIEVGGNILLNDMNINDIIAELLRVKVRESFNVRGDIIEFLSSSFEPTDLFLDYFKKGEITSEKLCCLTEIVGQAKGEVKRYTASTEIDIAQTINKNPLATATSLMVSILPTILIDKLMEEKISERGVIAPAALKSSSEIVEEAKMFDINFKESV
jgi:saccharopine dehydrogenase-like NADP-dependent oxidoreductase